MPMTWQLIRTPLGWDLKKPCQISQKRSKMLLSFCKFCYSLIKPPSAEVTCFICLLPDFVTMLWRNFGHQSSQNCFRSQRSSPLIWAQLLHVPALAFGVNIWTLIWPKTSFVSFSAGLVWIHWCAWNHWPVTWPNFNRASAAEQMAHHLTLKYFGVQRSSRLSQ